MTTEPRIAPGNRGQIGPLAWLIANAGGRRMRVRGPLNLFTTLGRHRRLFLPWLWFAGTLMPRGRLPRADTELLILRVAHNCGCEYEWRHHERIAPAVGLSPTDVQRVRSDDGDGFSPRRRLLLRAADELHATRNIGDELYSGLRTELSDVELIELCMLVGHYEMLAMTINSVGVQPEERKS